MSYNDEYSQEDIQADAEDEVKREARDLIADNLGMVKAEDGEYIGTDEMWSKFDEELIARGLK